MSPVYSTLIQYRKASYSYRVELPRRENVRQHPPVGDHSDDEERECEGEGRGLDNPQNDEAAHLAKREQVHLPGTDLETRKIK